MGGDDSGMGHSDATSAWQFYATGHCVSRTVRLQRSRGETGFLPADRGYCCASLRKARASDHNWLIPFALKLILGLLTRDVINKSSRLNEKEFSIGKR